MCYSCVPCLGQVLICILFAAVQALDKEPERKPNILTDHVPVPARRNRRSRSDANLHSCVATQRTQYPTPHKMLCVSTMAAKDQDDCADDTMQSHSDAKTCRRVLIHSKGQAASEKFIL